MGIAVRSWTTEDLSKALCGDKWLTTLLANAKTFDDSMMFVLTQSRINVKTYHVRFEDDEESTTIYATDDEMLLKFLEADYTRLPIYAMEVITTFRDVSFPQTKQ